MKSAWSALAIARFRRFLATPHRRQHTIVAWPDEYRSRAAPLLVRYLRVRGAVAASIAAARQAPAPTPERLPRLQALVTPARTAVLPRRPLVSPQMVVQRPYTR